MSYGKEQQPGLEVHNTIQMFPAGEAGAGTVTTSGVIVTGTGTSFLSDVKKDEYIRIGSQVRQIRHIFSDDRIDVNRPFTPDVAGATAYEICRGGEFSEVTIKAIGGDVLFNSIKNDGVAISDAEAVSYEQGDNNIVGPIIIDPNGNSYKIATKQ